MDHENFSNTMSTIFLLRNLRDRLDKDALKSLDEDVQQLKDNPWADFDFFMYQLRLRRHLCASQLNRDLKRHRLV